MDRDFCRQADKDMLVEAYVAGKLKGEALQKFEAHLATCAKHLHAVSLEKALKKGIAEFARSEMKWKIRQRLEEKERNAFCFTPLCRHSLCRGNHTTDDILSIQY